MEFRRIETRKVLRYRELVSEDCETKKILQELKNNNLEFSAKIRDFGGTLKKCHVMKLDDGAVTLFSSSPRKLNLSPSYSEIEQIEVESNCDFIAEENDEGGRWSRLL